jgi:alkylation response protein AidB-like acyl-CoA dehydrogenase
LENEIPSSKKPITSAVVLLRKNHRGVTAGPNWQRMGVLGITLAPLILRDVAINTEDVIG